MDDNVDVASFIYPSGRDPGPPPTRDRLYVLAMDAYHGVFGALVRSVWACFSGEGDGDGEGGDAVPLVGVQTVGTPELLSPVSEASSSSTGTDTGTEGSSLSSATDVDAHLGDGCDRTEDVQYCPPAIADHPASTPHPVVPRAVDHAHAPLPTAPSSDAAHSVKTVVSVQAVVSAKNAPYAPHPVEPRTAPSQAPPEDSTKEVLPLTRLVASEEPHPPKSQAPPAPRPPVNLTQLTGPTWSPPVQEVIVLWPSSGPTVPDIIVTSPDHGLNFCTKDEDEDEKSVYSPESDDLEDAWPFELDGLDDPLEPLLPVTPESEDKATCSDEEDEDTEDRGPLNYGLEEPAQELPVRPASPVPSESEDSDATCVGHSSSDSDGDEDPKDTCPFHYELEGLAPGPGPSMEPAAPASSSSEDASCEDSDSDDDDDDDDLVDKSPFYYELEDHAPVPAFGPSIRPSSPFPPEPEVDNESCWDSDDSEDPEDLCPFHYDLEEPVSCPSMPSVSIESDDSAATGLESSENIKDDHAFCCLEEDESSLVLPEILSPEVFQSVEAAVPAQDVPYLCRLIEILNTSSQVIDTEVLCSSHLVASNETLPLKSQALSARRPPIDLTQLIGPSWNPPVQEVIVLVSSCGPGMPSIVVTSPDNGPCFCEDDEDEESVYSQSSEDPEGVYPFAPVILDAPARPSSPVPPEFEDEEGSDGDEDDLDPEDLCPFYYDLEEPACDISVQPVYPVPSGHEDEDIPCMDDSESDGDEDPEDMCAFYYELDNPVPAVASGSSMPILSSASPDLGSDNTSCLDNNGDSDGPENNHAFCYNPEEHQPDPSMPSISPAFSQPMDDPKLPAPEVLTRPVSPGSEGGDVTCLEDSRSNEDSSDDKYVGDELVCCHDPEDGDLDATAQLGSLGLIKPEDYDHRSIEDKANLEAPDSGFETLCSDNVHRSEDGDPESENQDETCLDSEDKEDSSMERANLEDTNAFYYELEDRLPGRSAPPTASIPLESLDRPASPAPHTARRARVFRGTSSRSIYSLDALLATVDSTTVLAQEISPYANCSGNSPEALGQTSHQSFDIKEVPLGHTVPGQSEYFNVLGRPSMDLSEHPAWPDWAEPTWNPLTHEPRMSLSAAGFLILSALDTSLGHDVNARGEEPEYSGLERNEEDNDPEGMNSHEYPLGDPAAGDLVRTSPPVLPLSEVEDATCPKSSDNGRGDECAKNVPTFYCGPMQSDPHRTVLPQPSQPKGDDSACVGGDGTGNDDGPVEAHSVYYDLEDLIGRFPMPPTSSNGLLRREGDRATRLVGKMNNTKDTKVTRRLHCQPRESASSTHPSVGAGLSPAHRFEDQAALLDKYHSKPPKVENRTLATPASRNPAVCIVPDPLIPAQPAPSVLAPPSSPLTNEEKRMSMSDWMNLVLIGGGGNIRTQTFCHALYTLQEEENDAESLSSLAESTPPLTPVSGLFPLPGVLQEALPGVKSNRSSVQSAVGRSTRRSDFRDDPPF